MSLYHKDYAWERVRLALANFVEQVTGLSSDDTGVPGEPDPARIAWAENDQGPMPKPHVAIVYISDVGQGFYNEQLKTVPTLQRLTVTETTAGEGVAASLIWADVLHVVEGGDDLTATRDKFLAAMQAKIARNGEPLIAVANGAASVDVSGLTYSYPDVKALLGCTLAVPAPEEATARVKYRPSVFRARVQLNGFKLTSSQSDNDAITNAAIGMGRTARAAFEHREGLEFLNDFGLGVQGTPARVQNASVPSGALRELRVFFDVSIVTEDLWCVFADQDPTVDQTIDQFDPPSIEGAFVVP